MTAPKVLRAPHSTHAIVQAPLADFLRDLEGRLAQAQIASEKRLIDSQVALAQAQAVQKSELAQAQAVQKSELAQAQIASEKRLIDRMNTNNFKVAALTIGGAAAFGTFLLFILQNAGFQVLNPYLPLERKP